MKTLRSLVVAASRPPFSGSFLPLPLRRARTYWAVYLLLGTGCAGQAWKVASYLNTYDFVEARFEDRCVSVQVNAAGVVECRALKAKLDEFRKHLGEASKAVKAGGAADLQLAQIKKDAKGLR